MDAYDHCKHIVDTWPNRWTGSRGERGAGDWMEEQLARMGCQTRQTRFDCPGWEYEGEEFYLEGEPLAAGAQFYSSIDDMRWITREAMAREVGIGMDIVKGWIAESGVW